MKTKAFYITSVFLMLLMSSYTDVLSQSSNVLFSGDENWDAQFGIPGMNHDVNCFLKNENLLYAGGEFTMAGGRNINRIAKWDGTSWSGVGVGLDENAVLAIGFYQNDLYAGGYFYHSNGQRMFHFARWNGTEWVQPGTEIDLQVNCLVSSDDTLYLGGCFTTSAGKELYGIAAWDGSEFHSLAGGFRKSDGTNPCVKDIKFFGGDLYAGGSFSKAGGIDALNIAKWNGTSWSSLGEGINCDGCAVYSLAVMGDDLYVGGDFSMAGGVAVSNIAKWDGTRWSAVGSGINGPVFVLAVAGDKLFAGGYFSEAGGVSAKNIAGWDGHQWAPLGSGTNGWINALYADGDMLYVGGRFSLAGNKPANNIALWNRALSVEEHMPDSNAVSLTICPNPAVSVISLQSPVFRRQSAAGSQQPATIEIFDLNGRKLLEKQIPKGTEEMTVDVSRLKSGVYFCRVQTENGSVTKKLIIQK